ncbi:MAG: hypothetical protein ACI837_001590 [Crocinitomicaceae bacterium]|jgi:hypothetical protein
MKEPIENLLKQSLKGHEMPYSPDAWSAMQARLDVVSPVHAPRSTYKYYIAAAGLGLTAVAAYFIFTHTAVPEETTLPKLVQNETTVSESSNSQGTSSKIDETSNTIDSDNSNPELNGSTTVNPSATNPLENQVVNKVNGGTTDPTLTNVDTKDPNKTNGKPIAGGIIPILVTKTHEVMAPTAMNIPTVPNLCMNEEFSINNTNDRSIVIVQPDGRNFVIEAGKMANYSPTMEGTYSIGYMADANFQLEGTFAVKHAPESDFSIDFVNKFENGIPTTQVRTGALGDTYTWKAGRQTAEGTEADLHFYKKGKQTIALTVSKNGCSSTSEKSFYVEEDYNLMAMNSFTPSSSDARVSTFMPFALTKRQLNFKMVIFDSKDGGVVYETSDATLPWDGTDKRTGIRNTDIATYIWKVVLMNPERNEPAEYIGTITKQ